MCKGFRACVIQGCAGRFFQKKHPSRMYAPITAMYAL